MEYVTLSFSSEFFNAKDTLECGQIFRFSPYKKGYLVFSEDKCAYVYTENRFTYLICLTEHKGYFLNFFDTERDYSLIVNRALTSNGCDILKKACEFGKGIRILNQNSIEALISFIISQNNNIPRIKSIIEKICKETGESKRFLDFEYYAFPTLEKIKEQPLKFFKKAGLGYRAEYIKGVAELLESDIDFKNASSLSTEQLKKVLLGIKGVGPKVCDCVLLFGFHKTDVFPVDTWMEKVYKQDFNGELKDRKKISDWFVSAFLSDAGYFQQYMFYYKRYLNTGYEQRRTQIKRRCVK